MSPAGTKKKVPKELAPEMRGSSEQREKDLDRARWLTTLAGKLLQEADELRNKWGAKVSAPKRIPVVCYGATRLTCVCPFLAF